MVKSLKLVTTELYFPTPAFRPAAPTILFFPKITQ